MKRYLKFIAVGTFFSTVEEFLTVVVLRRDLASYVFTLLVLFPVFLTFVWLSSRPIGRLVPGKPVQDLAHYFVYGCAGLLIEWFVIGLSPWSDPSANPALMLVFQLGMFSFWATVGFAPRLFLQPDELSRAIRRAMLKFYIPYFLIVYLVAFTAPEQLKFVTIIALILFGYLFLNVFYLKYFRRSFARAAGSLSAAPGI
jgi:hypothetical protein